MNNNFVTFIVTSTINTVDGNPEQRFEQTLTTLDSIKKKVADAKIVFIDTSTIPITDHQKSVIAMKADYCIYPESTLLSRYINSNTERKSLGEVLAMDAAIKFIIKNNIVGRRIFKISGRYKLSDSFNIDKYDSFLNGKYTFKQSVVEYGAHPKDPNMKYSWQYLTTLWSMCGTLVYEFQELLDCVFANLLGGRVLNLEVSYNTCIPKEKVCKIDHLHVEGTIAKGNKPYSD